MFLVVHYSDVFFCESGKVLVAKTSSLMHTASLTVVELRSHANDDGDDIALTVIIATCFTSQRGHNLISNTLTYSPTFG